MILLVTVVVFFLVHKDGNEYSSIPWTGNENLRTYVSSDNVLLLGDSEKQKIVARISLEKMRAVLKDGSNVERYESRDIVVNPRRSEVYVLFNDKDGLGGPYVGASVHVISSHFDGSNIKDIATLEGYDMPHINLSEDGAILHIEQLMKRGPNSNDIKLEKFDLDIAKLLQ